LGSSNGSCVSCEAPTGTRVHTHARATPTFALILWAPANAAQAEFSNCDMVFYNVEYCRDAKQITFDIAAQHFPSEQDTSPSGFPKRPAG
ncbi:MAG: hypothetical protein AB1670_23025, partial [Pseudomonadota bacterium]